MYMTKCWLKLLDSKKNKTFIKYFDTEFERDNYIRKSRHFTHIKILDYDVLYKIAHNYIEIGGDK